MGKDGRDDVPDKHQTIAGYLALLSMIH
jgi:hypothetical protein